MAWASFGRHILIFHDRLLVAQWRNICLHYAPPIIIATYAACFYIYTIGFYPCQNYFDFQSLICSFLCYVFYKNIVLWEYGFHYVFSTICILIFNVGQLARVLYSQRRLRQSINSRKHRKIIFQAASLSLLFLITNLPCCIVNFFALASATGWIYAAVDFCNYYCIIQLPALPFVFMTTLPNIGTNINKIIHHVTNRRTAPLT
ncbi:unnamed protein product [Rotaria magnacalcarata]|uniref:Vomeronasal type-1 receptor n=1 Tax=Rotaria magnacalcarata TaxID=392030 RepID=A0A815B906_9BILA|nr:unnamed protein product [Rotaria magnacalcarata]CAF4011630.1 unnamed protein product [Rotaria magnacalcarata]